VRALSVPVSRERGAVVLRPQGEVDYHTAPALTSAVEQVEGPWREVVVDLSRVPFMDSAGLHALLDLERCCRERGGHLVVKGVRGQPARVMELVGLTEYLAVTD